LFEWLRPDVRPQQSGVQQMKNFPLLLI